MFSGLYKIWSLSSVLGEELGNEDEAVTRTLDTTMEDDMCRNIMVELSLTSHCRSQQWISSTLPRRRKPGSTSLRFVKPNLSPNTTLHANMVFTDPCARTPLLLHGRQVPRLLQHHDRLLSRPDRRHLRVVRDRPLPTDRWQGQAH